MWNEKALESAILVAPEKEADRGRQGLRYRLPHERAREVASRATAAGQGLESADHRPIPVAHAQGRDQGTAARGDVGGPRRISEAHRQGHGLGRPLAEARPGGAPDRACQKIVDTAIVASEAVFGEPVKKFPRLWGLQALCEELLCLKIRRGSEAKQGARAHTHDTLEDALAILEVISRCLWHPSELDAWAFKAREVFENSQKWPGRRRRPRRAARQKAKKMAKA
ncbi:hypothetical protein DL768_008976 [Monosporascus sp. mg162]|nr:hypothetical protein DL768_008976 [Monosporascus sp. mg162]